MNFRVKCKKLESIDLAGRNLKLARIYRNNIKITCAKITRINIVKG